MANASIPFGAATLATVPASGVAAGDFIAAIEGLNTSKDYAPFRSGGIPQTGEAVSLWLPEVATATQVMDSAGNYTGPVTLVLAAPANLASAYTSPLAVTVDANAVVTTAAGTF